MVFTNHVFQIIGVLATVFSAFIGYLAYTNDTEYEDESGFNTVKLKVAEVVAPRDYTLSNPKIKIIKRNSYVSLKENDTAYLFNNEKYPFAVKKGYKDRVSLLVDGRRATIFLGDKAEIKGSECYMWLYGIKDDVYDIEVRC
ncbi:MAG: hypothetical protein ACRBCS_12645 [Cellvibrionaceae bacterium]